jgi:DNA-binding SARP family transcriptional activator/ABC-type oligopeptide transport system substrate-binding subunit
VRDGQPVALGGAKPRALLAFLLLHANEVVSRDRLIDALWGDRPPGTAEHSLDVQISRLRKALAPDDLLLTRSGGYDLQVPAEQIDTRRFESLLERARRANADGRPKDALAVLRQALELWRGPALGDIAYEDFARTEAERLEELRLVATEERIDAELALGHHDRLAPEIEALTARHPLRERLRGQQMLALYRAGRQAEALRVYGDTRRRLLDDLGIEPGQTLRELEQSILRQDPELGAARPLVSSRRRRVLVGALVAVVAGVVAAAAVLVTQGGAESASATAQPDSDVFLSARSGKVLAMAAVRDTAAVRFGAGSLWSVSSEGVLTRIDPASGKVEATVGLGIVKPGGIAFGAGSVWVTDAYGPTLLRVDPQVNAVVDRIRLPMKGLGTDLTGGVAVGAGSVWVGHGGFNPGAWVERLDAATGRRQHRFSILGGDANAVAFGDGALWVGSQAADELRKIDPQTNSITFTKPLRPGSHVSSIAVGGGFAWAAISPDATVWKVGRDGSLVDTIALPATAKSLRYTAGAVWVAVGEHGDIVRIDPTTDAVRIYPVGHDVTDVDVWNGLVASGVQPNAQDLLADLHGDAVRIGLESGTVFQIGDPNLPSTDPALYAPWDKNLLQFDYATCARLYNYADSEGISGKTIVPEVAAGSPIVSDGGRTYAIRLRDGFRFSPPSNAPVTAASFREAIERDLSPTFSPDYLDPRWNVLVGAKDYNAGRARHVSGVSAKADTLVLHLTQPEPDFTRMLALNVFCAVPPGTPIVAHGLESPIASAGPYYLAARTDSVAVLKRNPNYGGARSQRLDAIVFMLGVAAKDAAAGIAKGTLDLVFENDPTLAPNTEAARAAGSRYRLTPEPTGHTNLLAYNTRRPLFSHLRMRRAVQFALDRTALAALDPAGPAIPATRLLSPKVVEASQDELYPVHADVPIARRLAAGRKARVVLAMFDDTYNAAFIRTVREELARIGLQVTVLPLTNADFDDGGAGYTAKASRSDLVWDGLGAETSDPVSYLQQLGTALPARDRSALERISRLTSPARDREAAVLARMLERDSLFAVYDVGAIPELVSRRLACVVHQPEYPGVDLAALCLKN